MVNSPPSISLSSHSGHTSIPIPGGKAPHPGSSLDGVLGASASAAHAGSAHHSAAYASPLAADPLSSSLGYRTAAFPGFSASPAPSFGDSLHPDTYLFASSPSRAAGTPPDLAMSADYPGYMSPDFAHSDAGHHDGSLSLGTSATHGPVAVAAGSAGRRMRSGSLFSTNSIWNDDTHSANSQSHHSSTGTALDFFQEMGASGPSSISSFLSPSLAPQSSQMLGNPHGRNRSHTTSTIHAFPAQQDARLASSPFLYPVPNDASAVVPDALLPHIAELPGHTTRNRSQTYSGVKPKVPHTAMPSFAPASATANTSQFPQLTPHASLESTNDAHFSYAKPHLQDDCDLFSLQLTTSFDTSSLGPTNTLLLDNVPHFLDAARLYSLLCRPASGYQHYGRPQVLSVRVASTSNSKMALVVCHSVEVAMSLKANFNHLEIVPGIILYVAFAKVSEPPLQTLSHPQNQHPSHYLNSQNGQVSNGQLQNGQMQNGQLPNGHMQNGQLQNAQMQNAQMQNAQMQSASVQTLQHSSQPQKQSSATTRVSPPPKADSPEVPAIRATDVEILTIANSILDTVAFLTPQGIDLKKIFSIMKNASKFPKSYYQKSFSPLPEGLTVREFDSPKLRELRKSLENNEKLQGKSASPSDTEDKVMSQLDLEALSLAMLKELPELCYDHIGNTIVQKIVASLESPVVKLIMVKEIAPYLAQLGTHKNGTWAIQKIINLCDQDCKQKLIIADSLRPSAVKMFNDQFGNYVLQCCLKFGSPFNDFIFETLCNNFLEISSGRFGTRCIRTIVESAHDPKSGKNSISQEQLFLVAGLIVEYVNELVLNSNGSLLVTWFLDTFQESRKCSPDPRYELLCRRLIPNLVSLCKHKLAHLTVLKMISNRNDMVTRQRLLDCIFEPFADSDVEQYRPPSGTLEAILREGGDNTYGPAFIHKLVSNPAILGTGSESHNQRYQHYVVSQVKRALLEMNIGNLQPYKKLIDEVGLSTNRLNWAPSGNRKSKRSGHRNGKFPQQQAYSTAAPKANEAASYPPHNYQNMGYSYPENGEYNSYFPAHMASYNYQQEAHVMRQLEQLSLSSAAMGYTSNPGTPGAHYQQEPFF